MIIPFLLISIPLVGMILGSIAVFWAYNLDKKERDARWREITLCECGSWSEYRHYSKVCPRCGEKKSK